MRLFFGIILGIILTVGGAYIADSMTPTTGEAATQARMVNWDVVQVRFSNLGTNIKGMWGRLTGAPAATTPAADTHPADAPKPANP